MSNALNKRLLGELDESDLIYEYKKTGSGEIRDILIEKYIYIPHSIAKRYALKTLDYDDLYQCACLSLLTSLENFIPREGIKFSTFATACALNAVKRHIRDNGNYIKIPQRVYHIFYKARKLRLKNFTETGQYPTTKELADSLHVTYEEMECALNWGDNKITKSLEYFMHEGEDMVYSDLIAIEDNSLLLVENKVFLESCFNVLTDEEKQFLKYRYYDEMSQNDIAKKMNVSQMKISRMEKKVITILNNMYFKD